LSKNEEEIMITIAQTIEKRGEVRGKQESRLTIAKNMLAKGYSIKDIEEITGLTREAIEKLKQE
jgi:predicted transposase/invertase (TIGR01784 family)